MPQNSIELRRQRSDLNSKIQLLAKIEQEAGELTEEQLTEFQEMQSQFDKLTSSIQRAESASRMNAESALPISAAVTAPSVIVKKEAQQYAGAGMARLVMSIAAAKGDMADAAKFARVELNDSGLAMAIETGAASGGALVPQNIHSEVIELLRPRTVVRKLGAINVPLPNGNLSIPRQSSGATSSYVGEGTDINGSEPTFDDVKLSAKTMITLVPVSNQLIGRAGYNVEQLVLNDIINTIAVREDKAFLRDDGTLDTPTGFKATAETALRTEPWSGTADIAGIDAYLDLLVLKLMDSNSMLIKPGWALSPRSFMKIFGLRDGNGNKVYPEMNSGMLKGWPVFHTTTIPTNLGGGTESEIYFADWNDVVIAESDDMTIDFSREATYKDSTGALVSAFSRNQSLIRVVANHDIGFRHNEGLVLGTGVTW